MSVTGGFNGTPWEWRCDLCGERWHTPDASWSHLCTGPSDYKLDAEGSKAMHDVLMSRARPLYPSDDTPGGVEYTDFRGEILRWQARAERFREALERIAAGTAGRAPSATHHEVQDIARAALAEEET